MKNQSEMVTIKVTKATRKALRKIAADSELKHYDILEKIVGYAEANTAITIALGITA